MLLQMCLSVFFFKKMFIFMMVVFSYCWACWCFVFIILSHPQNAGQNYNLKIANKFFKKGGTVQILQNDSNK